MTTTEISRPARSTPKPKGHPPGGTPNSDLDHRRLGTHTPSVEVGPTSPRSTPGAEPNAAPAEGTPTTRTASVLAAPKVVPPSGSQLPRLTIESADPNLDPSGGDTYSTTGQTPNDTQATAASGGPISQQARTSPSATIPAPAGSNSDRAAKHAVSPNHAPLLDPTLLIAAEIVDDLEKSRVANENRLRQLTRDQEDADGEERGFGLDASHPAVARIANIVDGLGKLEHEAVLNLQKAMRDHPLGPWVKVQRGIGEKQAARLLAAIGDPYWNTKHNRPRTVSELWAYCGYHVLPAGQIFDDAHGAPASGTQTGGGDTGHWLREAQRWDAGVAPRRQRGQTSNWSEDARKRAWLIVQSVIKSGGPWREVYDARKATTEGKLHAVPCVRCGPKGKPAPVGSPLSDGHRHADAIRITAKAILKALWVESKRLHEVGA
jgi:hypothetical protein